MKFWIPNALAVLAFTAPTLVMADELSLKVENDILSGGSDGHYTSGIELGWGFKPQADHWLRSMAELVPGWSAEAVDAASYRFGHQIYTPEDIERSDLQSKDRPYAGLMFAGFSIFKDEQLQGWRETGELGVDIGMVGPAAGAKKIQKGVHKLTGSDEPEGWSHQLRNEPFVNLSYEQRWWLQSKLAGLEVEYGPSAGFAAGNLYTYASSGLGVRIGQGLERSAAIPAVAPSFGANQYFKEGGGFAWYGFANVQGRYMAQNMLLDGNTWKDSASVNRRDWVGDAQAGVAVSFDSWQATLSTVWRTHEFEGQEQHDQFGALTVSTAF
jgi:hypothetical protein